MYTLIFVTGVIKSDSATPRTVDGKQLGLSEPGSEADPGNTYPEPLPPITTNQ